MSGTKFFASILLLLVGAVPGCAAANDVRQSEIDAISDKCGLDRSAMQLQEENTLRLQPPSETKFEALDCALQAIKNANFPNLKMGFVGNEHYESEAN